MIRMGKCIKNITVFGKDFYAKESFDQHFMIDDAMLKSIYSAANISKRDIVLEIGPGNGSLTFLLIKGAKKVIAVEIDKELVKLLKKNMRRRNLEIVNDSVLNFIKKNRDFDKIVSNLPYMIAEPLFMELPLMKFKLAAFTISKSFAKIIIRDDDARKSRLDIITDAFFDIKFVCDVPKSAFIPLPRKKSCIISLRPYTIEEYKGMKARFIVRELFLQKKRKIKKALFEALIEFDKNFREGQVTKRIAKEIVSEFEIKEIYDKKFNALTNNETIKLYEIIKKI